MTDPIVAGNVAMCLTIAYVTFFMGLEGRLIVRTKIAPRLGVLLPQAACFGAWSYAAYVSSSSSPMRLQIIVSNLVGCAMSLLLCGLAVHVRRQKRRAQKTDDATAANSSPNNKNGKNVAAFNALTEDAVGVEATADTTT